MNKPHDIRSVFENRRAQWRFVYYAPGDRMAPHRHDCAQFSLVVTGAQRETSNGNAVESPAMWMALKPAGFRHEAEFGGDGALLLSINLYACDEDDRDIRFDRWRVRQTGDVRGEWDALIRAMRKPAPDGEALDDITDDLLTAIIDAEDGPARSPAPGWLLRARSAVIETELSVEQIARDAGVHRVHLSRSFRRHFSVSVSEQRRRARLARAATAIIRDRARPADASAVSGFSDQAHLTRDMRRETGLTPGALARIFRAS